MTRYAISIQCKLPIRPVPLDAAGVRRHEGKADDAYDFVPKHRSNAYASSAPAGSDWG